MSEFRCTCQGGPNHCYCHIAGTTPDCEHCATTYWRDDYVPPHRKQRHSLPESDSVIAAARKRRQVVLDTLHPWTRSERTEHEREARQEQGALDNSEIGA